MGRSGKKKGVCKLCGEEGKLCDSHIIPRSMFKYMAINDTRSQYFVANLSSKKPIERGQGGPSEYLLCSECDNQFSNHEGYAKRFIDGFEPPTKVRINENLIKMSGVDYQKLKLFILLTLWRASVSSLDDFKSIKLGPYEDRIKTLLIADNPGSEIEYPVILASLTGNWKDFIFKDQFRINHRRCYRFFIGGFCWMVLVTKQTIPEGLEHFIIKENGEALIVEEQATNTELMPEFARQLKQKGLFLNVSRA